MVVKKTLKLGCAILIALFAFPLSLSGQVMVESYLVSAKLDEGEAVLLAHLSKNPQDDEARFGLGVLQFMKSIEHLGQSMSKYGVDSDRNIPIFRLPVPKASVPEKVTYREFKEDIFQRFVHDLRIADETLAKIESDEVKLPLPIFDCHLDFNSDGNADPSESLALALGEVMGRDFQQQAGIEKTVICFDKADVHWLRGYTHLLCALSEIVLAYEQEDVWDVMARRFVDGAIVRHDFLMEEAVEEVTYFSSRGILDLIAGIHSLGMPLVDSRCLERAHSDLLTTIEQSRLMWSSIQAESDNDREWIPNPKQTTVVSRVRFTVEMVETWEDFLDEAESILKGETLIPFWRGTNRKRGVNLYRVFHEPREFDLVLWCHGAGAVPYLEEGRTSSEAAWRRFQRVFRGDFIGFAAWIN